MKITSKDCMASGKWIKIDVLTYEDRRGAVRKWECAARTGSSGAVVMIPFTDDGRVIVIRQFRPPASAMSLEFPAGLIEEGEDFRTAAVRELKEETGYVGTVTGYLGKSYNSPGLTSEFAQIVTMKVVMSEQKDVSTDFDDSEDIDTFLVPVEDMPSFVEESEKAGCAIDGKFRTFVLGMNFSSMAKKH